MNALRSAVRTKSITRRSAAHLLGAALMAAALAGCGNGGGTSTPATVTASAGNANSERKATGSLMGAPQALPGTRMLPTRFAGRTRRQHPAI